VNLLIRPGFRFAVVQGLLTNFHLPNSSLLLLVSALIGRQRLLDLYGEAIGEGYRFWSYGDAMWIAPEAVLPGARP
jgi:S-adenosylmethionine:tRNA ribosyltransferase-isomerase